MKTKVAVTPAAILVLLGWLAAGCVSNPEADWQARVGAFTYEDARREMGEPDQVVALPDGQRAADWLLRRGTPGAPARAEWRLPDISTAGVSRNTPLGPDWKKAVPGRPDRVLRLTFAPDAKLSRWGKTAR